MGKLSKRMKNAAFTFARLQSIYMGVQTCKRFSSGEAV